MRTFQAGVIWISWRFWRNLWEEGWLFWDFIREDIFWLLRTFGKGRWVPSLPSAVGTIWITARKRRVLFCGETNPWQTRQPKSSSFSLHLSQYTRIKLNLMSFKILLLNHLFPLILLPSLQHAHHRSFQTTRAVIQWVQRQWQRGGEPLWATVFDKEPM